MRGSPNDLGVQTLLSSAENAWLWSTGWYVFLFLVLLLLDYVSGTWWRWSVRSIIWEVAMTRLPVSSLLLSDSLHLEFKLGRVQSPPPTASIPSGPWTRCRHMQ